MEDVLNRKFKILPGIIIRYEPNLPVDECLFIYKIEEGRMFSGNKDTYEIIEYIKKGLSVNEIIKKISSEREIDINDIKEEVLKMLNFLLENGIISEKEGG